MRFFRTWVGVVAVLAVALLGVLALDRTHTAEVRETRSLMHSGCLTINDLVTDANIQAAAIERTRSALQEAARVAAHERGQTTKDRLEYSRLQGELNTPVVSVVEPMNCDEVRLP